MKSQRVKNRRGFTIIEVIIAVLVLSVGLLGLASSSALVTRMISQGQRFSKAAFLGNEKLELLRSMDCSLMTSGSESQENSQYLVTWWPEDITGVNAANAQRIVVTVKSPTGIGYRTDTLSSYVSCKR